MSFIMSKYKKKKKKKKNIYIYIYKGVEMADKPISTFLQPSNRGNSKYFLFLNKCLLSYIMKLFVL